MHSWRYLGLIISKASYSLIDNRQFSVINPLYKLSSQNQILSFKQ